MGALTSGGRLARRDEGAEPKSRSGGMTEEQRREALARAEPEGLPILCRRGCVARRSKIHEGYSPSSRLAAAPNLWQRTRSLFMRWVLHMLPPGAPKAFGATEDKTNRR